MSASLPEVNHMSRFTGGVLIAGLALSFAPILSAATAEPKDELKRVERALDEAAQRNTALEREAGAIETEIAELRHRSVRVAARAQKLEAEITALEQRTEALRAEEIGKSASLYRRRGQIAVLMAALQRIARHPPAALIALPTAPIDTIRSAMLLRAAVPELESQAVALRQELGALAGVRRRISETRNTLALATVGLDAERDRLEVLLEGKARLADRGRAESSKARKRMTTLAAEARDLQDLLNRLAAARRLVPPEPPPVRLAMAVPRARLQPSRAKPAPGGAWLPVIGRVIRGFGQKDDLGNAARGITIEARRAAQVIAPQGGTVVFAGPFRGLGLLLIIEHARGYHSLLAGLARIDAKPGENVLAGEPVGVLAETTASRPALYVELRRRGRPVNPLPWFAAGRNRVNG